MESTSATAASESESLIQALNGRGWSFSDLNQVKALIVVQSALHGLSPTVDLIESELANMDLRSIGAKSLPDLSLLRKSPYIHGPKVLQISSARDISQSSVVEHSNNHQRLLRLRLTDGHTEITAIEYSHINSLPDDVVPGTKVRLDNKAAVHSGIVCLNSKALSVVGGVVQSLYEEWQINQKYSGFSRSKLIQSVQGDSGGPPPFEKLQIGAPSRQFVPKGRFSKESSMPSTSSAPIYAQKGGNFESGSMGSQESSNLKVDNMNTDGISVVSERLEEKHNTEARPKEVAELNPVQNQAAAQKLLQKMSQPNGDDRRFKGRKHKGKGKQKESTVLTLDEWERRKAGANLLIKNELQNVSRDEELARQFQNQFDLEDLHVQKGPHLTEADNIRMSMFSFERDNGRTDDRKGSRGGGRRRGRGRGRGTGSFY